MNDDRKSIIKSIGKAIRFWRKLQGLDQLELSDRLGSVRSYIAKLENAHVGISIEKLSKIANALGVSPYTLLRGIPSEEEVEILLDVDADVKLDVTKEEMELLFCQRSLSGSVSLEIYKQILNANRKAA